LLPETKINKLSDHPAPYDLYQSLFKGRADTYAVRWEANDRSGYVPAYDLDMEQYRNHKKGGGTLENFPHKALRPLTTEALLGHWNGTATLGIYPLLSDNTSWFIAADFDEPEGGRVNWMAECGAFVHTCEGHKLPVYVERSRSGQGGHVWLFFESPYPAVKSRRLLLHMLAAAGSGTRGGKRSTFDRLFPNQDRHTGKGVGNLIALPLQKKALQQGNTAFLDLATGEPFADQWAFLRSIQKVSTTVLDDLVDRLTSTDVADSQSSLPSSVSNSFDKRMPIVLAAQIALPRHQCPPAMLRFLREKLNIVNSDYWVKRKTGKSTYQTEARFQTLIETDDALFLPRGFVDPLLEYCEKEQVPYRIDDQRGKRERVVYNTTVDLHGYQQAAVDATDKTDFGVIVAPPGTGKTIMALAIIARKQQPALIIVHRKQLFDQWLDRIEAFLGIPRFRIGRIDGGKSAIGHEITVAMMQSLQGSNVPETLFTAFGTIVVDECHHLPAKTFRSTLAQFNSVYLYGFTATPERKGSDEAMLFLYIGKLIHRITFSRDEPELNRQLAITIHQTAFNPPFNAATDNVETLLQVLIHDSARNAQIGKDIAREVGAGRKVLVLTERVAHVAILEQVLRMSMEVVAVTGEDPATQRQAKLALVAEGDFQVLVTTGQFLGEGTDIQGLDSLVLAFPFSFEGKLIQYLGRVQRGPVKPVIYDYDDARIDYLHRRFKERNKHYRALTAAGQLKSFEELVLVFQSRVFFLAAETIPFPIDCLDLPLPVAEFVPGGCWKIRVVTYKEATGEVLAEIIDYQHNPANSATGWDPAFYYTGIERIRFRSIDTAGLLKSVRLQKPAGEAATLRPIPRQDRPPEEQVILKTMKVPFSRVHFGYGRVNFRVFIEELGQELSFEIANADVRPEFGAIREYFTKALKKKLLTTQLAIRFSATAVHSAAARSADIDAINTSLIESVRFEFVKREIFRPKDGPLECAVSTFDGLLDTFSAAAKALFTSEQALLNDILNVKQCRHYQQLRYLSSKHEAGILKLRFVLQPFSFLFLLSGENLYHVVWETLDSEEATYIWHVDRTRDALRTALTRIEEVITSIRKSGRQDYLKEVHPDFSRVWHDYTDFSRGFITWKAALEERLR
jgi:superfamily II DNA or RNA helicase